MSFKPILLGAFAIAQAIGFLDVFGKLLGGDEAGVDAADPSMHAAAEAERAAAAAARAAAAAVKHSGNKDAVRAAKAAERHAASAARASAKVARPDTSSVEALEEAHHAADAAEAAALRAAQPPPPPAVETPLLLSPKATARPKFQAPKWIESFTPPTAEDVQAAARAAALPLALGLVFIGLVRRARRAGGSGSAASGSASTSSQVDRVLALLMLPTRTPAEEARMMALMLLLSQSLPPKGDGQLGKTDDIPWRLLWTEKKLWWAFGDNTSVAWDTKQGSMATQINVGPFRLAAHGRFVPTADSGAWGDKPVFAAAVEGGELALGPLRMPLLLQSGAGAWTVVYADTRVRVFRSPECGLAAQVPEATLPPVQEEAPVEA